jgi:hypothetical protein
MSALEHHELLSQRKIFKKETTTGGKETSAGAKDEPQDLEHAPCYNMRPQRGNPT